MAETVAQLLKKKKVPTSSITGPARANANYAERLRLSGTPDPVAAKKDDDRNLIEKALNTPKNSGLLGNILDVVSRFNYASANVAKEVTDKAKSSPLDVLRAAGRGMAGIDRTTFSDVLPKLPDKLPSRVDDKDVRLAMALMKSSPEMARPEFGRNATAFALDVLADPTTYLTLGAGAAGKTSLKIAGKEIPKTAQAISAAKKAVAPVAKIPGYQSTVDTLGKTFKRTYVPKSAGEAREGIQEGIGLIDEAVRESIFGEKKAIQESVGAFKGIDEKARSEASRLIEEPINERLARQQAEKAAERAGSTKKKVIDVGKITTPAKTEKLLPQTDLAEILDKEIPGIVVQKVPAVKIRTSKGIDIPAARDATKPTLPPVDNAEIDDLLKTASADVPRGISGAGTQRLARKNVAGATLASKSQWTKNTANIADLARKPLPNTDAGYAAKITQKAYDDIAETEIAEEILAGKVPDYVTHLYTDPPDKVRAAYLEHYQRMAANTSQTHRFAKQRMIPSIEEAKKIGLHPIEDVRTLVAVRKIAHVRAMANKKMIGQLKQLGPEVVQPIAKSEDYIKAVSKDWVRGRKQGDPFALGKEFVEVPVPGLQGYKVHPELAKHLQRIDQLFINDKEAGAFIRAWDKLQDIWKGNVTVLNPFFHARNAIGNFFNNWLADVDAGAYAKALEVMSGNADSITLGGKIYKAQDLMDIFERQGLRGYGAFKGDLLKTTQETIQEMAEKSDPSILKRTISKAKHPIKTGRNLGDMVETHGKLSHFIDRLSKGDTVEQATKSVKKYLFQYNDLSPVERNIFRRFIPFYSFTRFNLPLQLEHLITKPGKLATVQKVSNAAENATATEGSPKPEWMVADLTFPIGKDKDGNVVYLTPDFPLNQISMLGSGAARELLGMLSPFVKAPFEMVLNKQLYSGAPITTVEGTPGAIRDYAKYLTAQLGTVPRTIGDLIAMSKKAEETGGTLPPAPDQIPVLKSMVRKVNPEREKAIQELETRDAYANYVKYKKKQGEEVPTLTELRKNKPPSQAGTATVRELMKKKRG